MGIEPGAQRMSPWGLFSIWLGLGAQSWGGGAATLLLIRREVVDRRAWISGEEFTRYWAICQMTPGINLLGLTVLIGWRMGRAWGAVLALLGLLLPSVTITAALTAVYASVSGLTLVEAALRGVIPATVGLGLLLSWQMGAPIMRQAHARGRADLMVAGATMLGAGAAVLLWQPPVVLVLLTAGCAGALWGWLRAQRER